MSTATSWTTEGEVRWSLIDTVRRIIRGRFVLLGTTFLGLALGLLLLLFVKPYYFSEAVFLPPKSNDVVGGASPTSLLVAENPSDTYLGLLASRTVQDDVVDHLHLMSVFHVDQPDKARAILATSTRFSVNKSTLINVDVTAKDPKLAASIANAYLDALYRINGQMVASASAHRAGFFEEQLQRQKDALSRAELDLKTTQERSGVVLPTGEAQADLSATAQLQAQLGAAEARLAGLLIGGTEQNPEVIQARSLVDQLRGQIARQQGAGVKAGLTPTGRLPELTFEAAEKEREVKLREGVYDNLVQQYEKARLSSIDPGPQLQIVDFAIPAVRKAGPSRKLYVAVGTLLGFFLGLAYLLITEPIRQLVRTVREPEVATRR